MRVLKAKLCNYFILCGILVIFYFFLFHYNITNKHENGMVMSHSITIFIPLPRLFYSFVISFDSTKHTLNDLDFSNPLFLYASDINSNSLISFKLKGI